MKKVRNALLMGTPYNGLSLLISLEQVGAWILSAGVDWNKLPIAFVGASISTYIALYRAALKPGEPAKHHPLWEWLFRLATGTVLAMVGWPDVHKSWGNYLSEGSCVIVAGVIGWLFCEGIYWFAKTKSENPSLPKS
jgi:hypothetical protein